MTTVEQQTRYMQDVHAMEREAESIRQLRAGPFREACELAHGRRVLALLDKWSDEEARDHLVSVAAIGHIYPEVAA